VPGQLVLPLARIALGRPPRFHLTQGQRLGQNAETNVVSNPPSL
jgi:hypothetical protein